MVCLQPSFAVTDAGDTRPALGPEREADPRTVPAHEIDRIEVRGTTPRPFS